MRFIVDLHPQEYERAMLWHQFAGSPGRRANDWAAWAILVAAPLTVVLLLLFAPDALSIWFWPVALLAFAYSLYSTLIVRYQIRKQAATLLETNPALARTEYHIHEKGVKLRSEGTPGDTASLFLPWKELEQVAESGECFLFFVNDETILIVPKRCVPDPPALRGLAQAAGKMST